MVSLLKEIDQKKRFFKDVNSKIETLYFGGGTPSVLDSTSFVKILEKLKITFDIDVNTLKEFTIEVNPEDCSIENLSFWKSCGVNRLSIGIQSFDDNHLKWMNRRHNSERALNAFAYARRIGFDNISLDLIFGFRGLTKEQWSYNLETIIKLSPEHISTYQMSVEHNSKLGREYKNGKYVPKGDKVCQSEYNKLRTTLAKAGYVQYEVSNFSKKGFEAIHNTSYWNMKHYLGLGPSAHSYDGKYRYWNAKGNWLGKEKKEKITPKIAFNENIMLSLRQSKGLNLKAISYPSQRVKKLTESTVDKLLEDKLISITKDGVKIKKSKLFISDSIIREFFI